MVARGEWAPCVNDDADDTLRATNLRSFTRIGGPSGKRHLCMASLQLKGHVVLGELYNIHVCDGVLVAPDLILMVANCASYPPPPPGPLSPFERSTELRWARAT